MGLPDATAPGNVLNGPESCRRLHPIGRGASSHLRGTVGRLVHKVRQGALRGRRYAALVGASIFRKPGAAHRPCLLHACPRGRLRDTALAHRQEAADAARLALLSRLATGLSRPGKAPALAYAIPSFMTLARQVAAPSRRP